MNEVRNWRPPQRPDYNDGRYIDLLQSVLGAGWHHNRAGYWECLLCEREAGVGHERGCPVDALEQALNFKWPPGAP